MGNGLRQKNRSAKLVLYLKMLTVLDKISNVSLLVQLEWSWSSFA